MCVADTRQRSLSTPLAIRIDLEQLATNLLTTHYIRQLASQGASVQASYSIGELRNVCGHEDQLLQDDKSQTYMYFLDYETHLAVNMNH